MIERYLLDTNTISHIVSGKSPAARSRLLDLHSGVAYTSSITEGEVRYGLAKTHKPRVQASVEWLLSRLQILPWRSEEAQMYGILRAQQETLGRPLETMDMMIAAHAVAVGAILVTSDRAFNQVRGLDRIENWATDL